MSSDAARIDRVNPAFSILAIFGLNFIDVITTRIILANGGMEVNPIMSPLIDTWEGYALKLGLAGAVCLRLWKLKREDPEKVRKVSIGLVVFYFAVVGVNVVGMGMMG